MTWSLIPSVLSLNEGRVAVALAPRDPNADVSHVLGDGEFLSSDSTLRRLQPRINRLVVRFE